MFQSAPSSWSSRARLLRTSRTSRILDVDREIIVESRCSVENSMTLLSTHSYLRHQPTISSDSSILSSSKKRQIIRASSICKWWGWLGLGSRWCPSCHTSRSIARSTRVSGLVPQWNVWKRWCEYANSTIERGSRTHLSRWQTPCCRVITSAESSFIDGHGRRKGMRMRYSAKKPHPILC